ncbi:hypothetical protein G6F46_008373 [Rhizopus delemar]|uniref:Reverse transcriptase domain-containing protein n=3 Tax=Rhizopus TaxID=4842 RepID=I1C5N2_RHIO9|nr:hypothetical protein RO3G_08467 [Rhizopus delemar RA 99-880]KAG1454904.1 hypothetical protein G6F55_007362 [Rhizopus delemar]KAG1540143.1 hypothetical protein G6F51_008705 [Rhizopus arrhizus]KAG1494407.1 hypothetical protein G6F54_007897 [Rhizopus delemar]KAG1508476.1 hypothetical protein G6F53_008166 [Rhizopus delemar]|eukprot:EIE83762.1 hypothetical protein RO3G_08467 [Rhizopus delemar RA 99-880]
MDTLLQPCKNHSYQLGYRWNPSKCVILDLHNHLLATLYGEKIPIHSSFPYLGIPFRPGGYLDTVRLANRSKAKALATMNQLSAIDVHPKGFAPLLATRFYRQIVRAQLEYGLAITKLTTFLSKQLENAQDACLRRIFGGSRTSSTMIMLHMSNLPTMQERAYTLQSQFLLRSITLPEDALLHHLLPLIRQPRSYSHWYKLSKSPIWKRCSSNPESLDHRSLRSIQLEYRQDNLNRKCSMYASVLLMHCHPIISLDPVLWLPMSKSERSRCIRWRLGWLPGGRYKACPRRPNQSFTKAHVIHCLQMHRRLMMPETRNGDRSSIIKK